jgi:hypothetical protein
MVAAEQPTTRCPPAGLVLLQLAVPGLRLERSLRTFRQTLERNGYDLPAWRKAAYLTKRDSQWLDANDGAGGQRPCCGRGSAVAPVSYAPCTRDAAAIAVLHTAYCVACC